MTLANDLKLTPNTYLCMMMTTIGEHIDAIGQLRIMLNKNIPDIPGQSFQQQPEYKALMTAKSAIAERLWSMTQQVITHCGTAELNLDEAERCILWLKEHQTV